MKNKTVVNLFEKFFYEVQRYGIREVFLNVCLLLQKRYEGFFIYHEKRSNVEETEFDKKSKTQLLQEGRFLRGQEKGVCPQ